MDRRDFFKKSFTVGAAVGLTFLANNKSSNNSIFSQDLYQGMPDLVAIKGGEAEAMFDKGIEAIGGIRRFVKKGQTVVIKPNIGWNRTPDYGATTNPRLIKRIIEHCYNAGAKKVYVFDNTCNEWSSCYKVSGIENAVKEADGQIVPGNSENYFHEVVVPGGSTLKRVKVHELILNTDVFINVPVLKHHGSTSLTIAMKNLMGAVWDRYYYHSNGLNQCIAEFCLYKKPDLNIVDAYTVMMRNGPRGRSMDDVSIIKNQLISTDIVAVDAAASKIYGIEPDKIGHIKIAYNKKIGNMNLDQLKIKKISL